MILYISGPITNGDTKKPDITAHIRAHRRLAAKGYTVLNPTAISIKNGT